MFGWLGASLVVAALDVRSRRGRWTHARHSYWSGGAKVLTSWSFRHLRLCAGLCHQSQRPAAAGHRSTLWLLGTVVSSGALYFSDRRMKPRTIIFAEFSVAVECIGLLSVSCGHCRPALSSLGVAIPDRSHVVPFQRDSPGRVVAPAWPYLVVDRGLWVLAIVVLVNDFNVSPVVTQALVLSCLYRSGAMLAIAALRSFAE